MMIPTVAAAIHTPFDTGAAEVRGQCGSLPSAPGTVPVCMAAAQHDYACSGEFQTGTQVSSGSLRMKIRKPFVALYSPQAGRWFDICTGDRDCSFGPTVLSVASPPDARSRYRVILNTASHTILLAVDDGSKPGSNFFGRCQASAKLVTYPTVKASPAD